MTPPRPNPLPESVPPCRYDYPGHRIRRHHPLHDSIINMGDGAFEVIWNEKLAEDAIAQRPELMEGEE